MTTKKPRRTAERIVEVTLALFNRHGEPNVSTTAISAELGISPGNLYYHYAAKDELINTLFDRYEAVLDPLLEDGDAVTDIEQAVAYFERLLEATWCYRFLYRDLNDLLSKNRRLEHKFQQVLHRKTQALHRVVDSLRRHGRLRLARSDANDVVLGMIMPLTYWLSFEYVRDPRNALEPDKVPSALSRGAYQMAHALAPFLEPDQAEALRRLGAQATPPARPLAAAA